jgi:hypothetical protein
MKLRIVVAEDNFSLYNFARWLVHSQNDAEDLYATWTLANSHSFGTE